MLASFITPRFPLPISVGSGRSKLISCPSSPVSMSAAITHEPAALLRIFRNYIPKLDGTSIKGEHGRIAIIGGSYMYTGAPYFAGISSMKAGGDLCSVYTAEAAVSSIKAMSPDLMVVPSLKIPHDINAQAVCIGPGLGRDDNVLPVIIHDMKVALLQNIPLVLDADALFLLTNHWEKFETVFSDANSEHVILTPNVKEFKYVDRVLGKKFSYISKAACDTISVGDITCEVSTQGSLKRVGGQGDILAGILALFLSWVHTGAEGVDGDAPSTSVRAAAAVAACCVTRHAGYLAFEKHGRALLTSDIVAEIGRAVTALERGVL